MARKWNSAKLSKWAKAVKARDGMKCKKCGSRRKLHAHHVKPKAKFPSLAYNLSNGITLCQKCHIQQHKFMSKYYRKQNSARAKKRTNSIKVKVRRPRKTTYKVKIKR